MPIPRCACARGTPKGIRRWRRRGGIALRWSNRRGPGTGKAKSPRGLPQFPVGPDFQALLDSFKCLVDARGCAPRQRGDFLDRQLVKEEPQQLEVIRRDLGPYPALARGPPERIGLLGRRLKPSLAHVLDPVEQLVD